MTKKINEHFIKQLNPQAKVLFQEYNIAFENKMWASVVILSLTIIDNILNDANNLDYVDGLDADQIEKKLPYLEIDGHFNEIGYGLLVQELKKIIN